MSRLVGPTGVRGVDVTTERGTRKYNTNKKGIIEVNNPKHAKQMKAEGFFEASLMGATTNSENIGFNCTACGFGSWFKKCSRCGHENERIMKDGD